MAIPNRNRSGSGTISGQIVASEHDEQKALIKWWSIYSKRKQIPEILLFAIPNGGKRSIQTAAILRSEGVRPGIPDLFLAVETYKHAGLFIEMKRTKGGVVSDVQKDTIDLIQTKTSYCAAVCCGFDEARRTIEKYIETGEI